MANHPNIRKGGAGIPPATPTPEQVREIRSLAGHTQTQAAVTVHATLRAWQCWEAPGDSPEHRRVHPAIWHLYLRRCRDAGIKLPARYEKFLDEAIAGVKPTDAK